MKEEIKGNPTEAEKYFDSIVGVMKENDEFLHKNAEETCNEIIKIINDAIDYVTHAIKNWDKSYYVERAMAFFLHHILMPFSYAIYVDLLTGNLPVCFMELRLMIESLAKCYLADLKHPDRTFFQERLGLLDAEKLSTSRLLEELGNRLGLEREFIGLWGKLSNSWVHTKGIVDKTVSQIVEKSDVPSWALTLPMSYTKNDIDMIDELRRRIAQFGNLLTSALEKYEQERGFL